jgi:hypothetical protein
LVFIPGEYPAYPLPPSPTTRKRSPMTRGVVVGHQNIAYDRGAGRWNPKKNFACGARENEDDLGKHRL